VPKMLPNETRRVQTRVFQQFKSGK
jgi:hypothetical protein